VTDREKILLRAIEGMTRHFPVFYDEEVVNRLKTDKSLPDREKMLLAALVEMVDRCLDRYEDGITAFLNGPPMPAGIDAVATLANLGLMEVYSVGSRSSDHNDDDGLTYRGRILVRSAEDGAVVLLAELGLTTVRLAEWTEMGKKFLADNTREWDAWEERIAAEGDRKRKIAATLIHWTNEIAIGVFCLVYLLVRFKLSH
jgi:hypothetical protein